LHESRRIETLVLDGTRKHFAMPSQEATAIEDRDLIERHVKQVVVTPQALELSLLLRGGFGTGSRDP